MPNETKKKRRIEPVEPPAYGSPDYDRAVAGIRRLDPYRGSPQPVGSPDYEREIADLDTEQYERAKQKARWGRSDSVNEQYEQARGADQRFGRRSDIEADYEQARGADQRFGRRSNIDADYEQARGSDQRFGRRSDIEADFRPVIEALQNVNHAQANNTRFDKRKNIGYDQSVYTALDNVNAANQYKYAQDLQPVFDSLSSYANRQDEGPGPTKHNASKIRRSNYDIEPRPGIGEAEAIGQQVETNRLRQLAEQAQGLNIVAESPVLPKRPRISGRLAEIEQQNAESEYTPLSQYEIDNIEPLPVDAASASDSIVNYASAARPADTLPRDNFVPGDTIVELPDYSNAYVGSTQQPKRSDKGMAPTIENAEALDYEQQLERWKNLVAEQPNTTEQDIGNRARLRQMGGLPLGKEQGPENEPLNAIEQNIGSQARLRQMGGLPLGEQQGPENEQQQPTLPKSHFISPRSNEGRRPIRKTPTSQPVFQKQKPLPPRINLPTISEMEPGAIIGALGMAPKLWAQRQSDRFQDDWDKSVTPGLVSERLYQKEALDRKLRERNRRVASLDQPVETAAPQDADSGLPEQSIPEDQSLGLDRELPLKRLNSLAQQPAQAQQIQQQPQQQQRGFASIQMAGPDNSISYFGDPDAEEDAMLRQAERLGTVVEQYERNPYNNYNFRTASNQPYAGQTPSDNYSEAQPKTTTQARSESLVKNAKNVKKSVAKSAELKQQAEQIAQSEFTAPSDGPDDLIYRHVKPDGNTDVATGIQKVRAGVDKILRDQYGGIKKGVMSPQEMTEAVNKATLQALFDNGHLSPYQFAQQMSETASNNIGSEIVVNTPNTASQFNMSRSEWRQAGPEAQTKLIGDRQKAQADLAKTEFTQNKLDGRTAYEQQQTNKRAELTQKGLDNRAAEKRKYDTDAREDSQKHEMAKTDKQIKATADYYAQLKEQATAQAEQSIAKQKHSEKIDLLQEARQAVKLILESQGLSPEEIDTKTYMGMLKYVVSRLGGESNQTAERDFSDFAALPDMRQK